MVQNLSLTISKRITNLSLTSFHRSWARFGSLGVRHGHIVKTWACPWFAQDYHKPNETWRYSQRWECRFFLPSNHEMSRSRIKTCNSRIFHWHSCKYIYYQHRCSFCRFLFQTLPQGRSYCLMARRILTVLTHGITHPRNVEFVLRGESRLEYWTLSFLLPLALALSSHSSR